MKEQKKLFGRVKLIWLIPQLDMLKHGARITLENAAFSLVENTAFPHLFGDLVIRLSFN